MRNIIEMRQQRAALVQQARDILNKAESENRDLTAEETQEYDRIMADVDRRAAEIEREERLQGIENELTRSSRTVVVDPNAVPNQQRADQKLHETDEYRSAFWQAVRQGQNALDHEQVRMLLDPEVRALVTQTNTAGGYLVPNEFERTLVEKLLPFNVMRGLATVITTSSGTTQIPVESDFGTAQWIGEGAAYTDTDSTFAQVTLSAYKLTTMIKVSEELLNDSAFNIDNYVASAFARRMGTTEEAAFVNGDGTGKPTGVVSGATQGKVGATGQTTSVTVDDIIDLYHSLKRPYRPTATWMLADATAKAIRKLKDSTGQFIWQPGLQAGQPDRLLSRPVAISDNVPAMAASAKSILFGDFSYYWIADRQGTVMQRLSELYAANGQVGFRMFKRTDGKLILPEAVVYYQNSAT
ncbi:phage major capsid protein [Effusibacillus dendaii]|uniref:phage major capsid protein n=1 Tax=Effusibacillus dendaii TaxID=2743772 RepID=UPI001909092D|nr:phage major capsid protein [Effusibacillus dendaii]